MKLEPEPGLFAHKFVQVGWPRALQGEEPKRGKVCTKMREWSRLGDLFQHPKPHNLPHVARKSDTQLASIKLQSQRLAKPPAPPETGFLFRDLSTLSCHT